MKTRTLTLPSGLRVRVAARAKAADDAVDDGSGDDSLFADLIALFRTKALTLENAREGFKPLDVLDLPLSDFHVVRGVVAKAGLIDEEEVELECLNCGELIVIARPCEHLEIAPWEDDEAHDEELDQLAPVNMPLDLARPVPLGRVRNASTVTFRPRTARDAMPIFKALANDPLVIDAAFVEAMGITELGPLDDAKKIAAALEECEEDAFASVTDAFLAVHYPLRLACDVFCTKCKARNTIDAPHEREWMLSQDEEEDDAGDADGDGDGDFVHGAKATSFLPVPTLDVFVELAHSIAEPLIRAQAMPASARVELIVEDGTPDVDDGGVPLMGAYVPPPPHDATGVVMSPPRVTVYYQTFVEMERLDGRYDWEAELRETIEHELEHHEYFLRGDDPMDEEEHREIDREVVRVVGQKEATRRTLAVFGGSIPDFFRRSWLFVVIAAAALVIMIAEGRCGGVD